MYYPTVLDSGLTTFEATLDQLLSKRRELAQDMLSTASEIQVSEFEALLGVKG